MDFKAKTFLVIPGLGNSGNEHWQTLWEQNHSNFIRVQQENWDSPDCTKWIANIEKEVRFHFGTEIYLVAHSLGCLAVARWAQHTKYSISGALLVAPPDLLEVHKIASVQGFGPEPLKSLPFRSTLVASANDPFANISKAWQYAQFWQSNFINIGNKGHINAGSGLGLWDEGLGILEDLVQSNSYNFIRA